jgi:hypothetical protein
MFLYSVSRMGEKGGGEHEYGLEDVVQLEYVQ